MGAPADGDPHRIEPGLFDFAERAFLNCVAPFAFVRRVQSITHIDAALRLECIGVAGLKACGQTEHGVTSLVDLGLPVTMDEADAALRASFQRVFGPVEDASAPI